ncbi:PIN domain-containing protein [Streptomyces prunicolor]|uniref:PIN domain-containing protein n=1 Tax=Streptomyces prunicolor TaxID=67348 RepID=A0ABU4FIK5_9ACTN|nr:PIN domain-containing protein [Streptomyces prunicolor]MDV7220420.1 PIN domain-containing protein [Streptomyces prunicolor]
MIIFDTNAVNLLSPEGPSADIIRKLRQSKHHRVAVPWMVLEEMAAHKAHLYPVKHQSVLNALERLRDVLPWQLESSLEPLDLERYLDYWRGVYGEIFEVIETSDGVIRRAFQREAMALPPTKRGKDHSEGGRDAAIWFCVLEFLEQNPDQHVHFVTNNSKDFTDGTGFPYPMNDDIRGMEDRLIFVQDFAQVVSQFTREVSGTEAEAAAGELLRSLSVREGVSQTAVEVLNSPAGFAGLGTAGVGVEWHEWLASPEVDLLSVTDVKGHEIEGDVWYTAKASWLLYGLALSREEASASYVACVWDMKVLFSTAEGDETPTLLATEVPSPPDTDDEPCMRILQGLKQRVAGVAADAKQNLLAAQSSVERLVTEQLPPSMRKLDLATNQLARKFAADRAALQALMDSPGARFAQKAAADRAALQALLDTPGRKLARHLADSMPRLDIATAAPHPHAGSDTSEDDAEQLEPSGADDDLPEDEPGTDGSNQAE